MWFKVSRHFPRTNNKVRDNTRIKLSENMTEDRRVGVIVVRLQTDPFQKDKFRPPELEG